MLSRTSRTITKYLIMVSGVTVGLVGYRLDKAASSWGRTTYEQALCDGSKLYGNSSGMTIVGILVLFGLICAPDFSNGKCNAPTGSNRNGASTKSMSKRWYQHFASSEAQDAKKKHGAPKRMSMLGIGRGEEASSETR